MTKDLLVGLIILILRLVNFMRGARAITRYLSMVNTSLDPAFMVNNFLRDVQTGYFNLMAEEEIDGGRAKALEISKNITHQKYFI